MSITVVCGWATPPSWLRDRVQEHFPGVSVRTVYPHRPGSHAEAANILQTHEAQIYMGYSLGALWLLRHRLLLPPGAGMVLLAPILAFPREAEQGGKTRLGQLDYMIQRLQRGRENSSLVDEFLSQAGISPSADELKEIPGPEVLIRGLEFLKDCAVSPEAAQGCWALVGAGDPFLDHWRLKSLLPNLIILENAGHSPGPLLQALVSHPGVRPLLRLDPL